MADNYKAYLEDILAHIEILEGFLSGVNEKSAFFANLEKQFAVARALEIIGEASAKLGEDFRTQHPGIDWRALKAMRNLLIHEYAYVDAEEVWQACESDVPDLKIKIQKILNQAQN